MAEKMTFSLFGFNASTNPIAKCYRSSCSVETHVSQSIFHCWDFFESFKRIQMLCGLSAKPYNFSLAVLGHLTSVCLMNSREMFVWRFFFFDAVAFRGSSEATRCVSFVNQISWNALNAFFPPAFDQQLFYSFKLAWNIFLLSVCFIGFMGINKWLKKSPSISFTSTQFEVHLQRCPLPEGISSCYCSGSQTFFCRSSSVSSHCRPASTTQTTRYWP